MTHAPSVASGRDSRDARYDVVVCGGGPAGIGAAVMAGKAGVRTLLIERLGHVGGMHTGAGVTNWCDTAGGPVYDDMLRRFSDVAPVAFHFKPLTFVPPGRPALDTELGKAICMEMLREAGVDVLLLTHVEGAATEGHRVTGVNVVNKAGRCRIDATVVVDASADADVAAGAGAAFDMGDALDGRLQHCNFRVWYDGIDRERYESYAPKGVPADPQPLVEKIRQAHAQGLIVPPDHLHSPQRDLFPFNRRIGGIQFSSWEFEDVDPLDPMGVSRLLGQCQIAAKQCMMFYRANLPGYEQCYIRKLPATLGIRESRRIRGRYTLTAEDVCRARKFDDAIARGWFWLDLHDSPPGRTIPYDPEYVWSHRPAKGDWFEIPYRCLLPEEVQSLLVAGRCVSVDRVALGATRVMPTCMFLGSAAGTAAALAVKQALPPHELDARHIRAQLFADHQQTPAACERPAYPHRLFGNE